MATKLWKKLKAEAENLEHVKPLLFKYLEQGHPIEECCEAADISYKTIYEYHKRAEYSDETPDEIVEFVFEFKAARAKGARLLLDKKWESSIKTKITDSDGSTIETKTDPAPTAFKIHDRRITKDKSFAEDLEIDELTEVIESGDTEDEPDFTELEDE